MGFFSGRVTFLRFRLSSRLRSQLGQEHLDRLAAHAIGKQKIATADGIETGWTAGDHLLDTRFDLAKNIIEDTLHFALRIDSLRLPGGLLDAYTQVELEALSANNPTGRPSHKQRREARANAKDRLEKEARDGRFVQRKTYPLLWDRASQELLVGTTSPTALDQLRGLFERTFGHGYELLDAGRQAYLLAEPAEQTRGVDDAGPAPYIPGVSPSGIAWTPDEADRNFLGNEFLLWLWYVFDAESDTIALGDESEVTGMLARNLVLECPRGVTGRESIRSEGPAQLPEARRALQTGKLPRQAGLTLHRHGRQYELTLQAETLGVGSALLPAPEEEDDRARKVERVELLRHLIETLDLLYDAFGRRRFGATWSKDLAKMQKWLQRDDRARVAATS